MFDQKRDDVAWEFLDPTLEAMTATLTQEIRNFLHVIRIETYRNPRGVRSDWDYYGIPSEWKTQENGKRFYEAVDKIEKAEKRCVQAYKALIREGRHRLAIDVSIDESTSPET